MEQMKILLVLTDTLLGGVTTAAINLANELVKRGNEVDILNMCADDGNLLDKLDGKVNVLHLNKKQQKWNLTANSFRSQRSLLKKLYVLFWGTIKKITNHSDKWMKTVFSKPFSEKEYDVAIGYRQCAPCYYFVLNAVNARVRVGVVHGEISFMGDISSWKKYMPKLDRVAYVSKAVQMGFEDAYPELRSNGYAVYNMFDKDKISNLSNEDCGITFDKNKKNIVTVARIENEYKRIDLIPKICKDIQARTSVPFHWYIVGDGPDFEYVQTLINEYGLQDLITMTGAMDNPFSVVKNADFSVLPSKSEAYPMTVIESFIVGTPIVITNFGAAREMVEDGKSGLICDFSTEDLVEKILLYLNDDELLYSCREYIASQNYNNDKEYSQFLDMVGGKGCFQ